MGPSTCPKKSPVTLGANKGENKHGKQMAASIFMHKDQIAQLTAAQKAREATPGHVAIQPGEPGYVHLPRVRRRSSTSS
jgi:hypothetical protein